MKRTSRVRRAVSLTLVALVAGVWPAGAGDLDPPPGPIAPSMKSLTDVEPRIAISAATTPGDADSVFRITERGSYYLTGNIAGVAGMSGIEIAVGAGSVTIDLAGFSVVGTADSLDGIKIESGSPKGVAVRNGVVSNWGGSGLNLLFAGGSVVDAVQAIANGGNGINAGAQAVVTACTARQNGAVGIRAETGSVIERCTTNGNGGDGIVANTGGVVRDCACFFNGGDGINAGPHTLVESCVSNNNVGDGIRSLADARIRGNVCNVNGAAGVHCSNPANDIEDNRVSGNARGIDVDSAGNFVVRNIARSNTQNYAITGTQTIGPIITATGTIATTNPWANFEF